MNVTVSSEGVSPSCSSAPTHQECIHGSTWLTISLDILSQQLKAEGIQLLFNRALHSSLAHCCGREGRLSWTGERRRRCIVLYIECGVLSSPQKGCEKWPVTCHWYCAGTDCFNLPVSRHPTLPQLYCLVRCLDPRTIATSQRFKNRADPFEYRNLRTSPYMIWHLLNRFLTAFTCCSESLCCIC